MRMAKLFHWVESKASTPKWTLIIFVLLFYFFGGMFAMFFYISKLMVSYRTMHYAGYSKMILQVLRNWFMKTYGSVQSVLITNRRSWSLRLRRVLRTLGEIQNRKNTQSFATNFTSFLSHSFTIAIKMRLMILLMMLLYCSKDNMRWVTESNMQQEGEKFFYITTTKGSYQRAHKERKIQQYFRRDDSNKWYV